MKNLLAKIGNNTTLKKSVTTINEEDEDAQSVETESLKTETLESISEGSSEEDKTVSASDETTSKVTRTPMQAAERTPGRKIEFTPGRTTETGIPVLMPVDLTLERDDSISSKELSPMQMIKSKMKSQVAQGST